MKHISEYLPQKKSIMAEFAGIEDMNNRLKAMLDEWDGKKLEVKCECDGI